MHFVMRVNHRTCFFCANCLLEDMFNGTVVFDAVLSLLRYITRRGNWCHQGAGGKVTQRISKSEEENLSCDGNLRAPHTLGESLYSHNTDCVVHVGVSSTNTLRVRRRELGTWLQNVWGN